MVKKKIDILYKILNCGNTDIARCIECSPSGISRLRNESRQYKATSHQVARFVEGIYLYADKNDCLGVLNRFLNIPIRTKEEFSSSLILWLYDENDINISDYIAIKKYCSENKSSRNQIFGEKISKTMNLLKITNVYLASKINVDTSTISRFRCGKRIPNHLISDLLVTELLLRAEVTGKTKDLSKLCGISMECLSQNTFSFWLFNDRNTSNFHEIDGLLENINHFRNIEPNFSYDISKIVPPTDLTDNRCIYWGTSGLREAVTRFLSNSAQAGGELWLYSDLNMNWMTEDKHFKARWTALMILCLKNGVKIKIIHNIDRDISEMISAVQSWIPLYMSGLIEPYVCSKENDLRFSHTIFLRPGSECIYGSCVIDTEENGWFDYFSDKKRLNSIESEYEKLLENSVPLAKIFFYDNNVISEINNAQSSGKIEYSLLPTLSLGTMPETLLISILDRYAISDEHRNIIFSYYHNMKKKFDNMIINELLHFESSTLTPIRIDIPKNICGKYFYYTSEEFYEHLKCVQKLAENNPNYNLTILPQMPFENLKITATDNNAIVIRSDSPHIAFDFLEMRMVHTFKEYLKSLQRKYEKNGGGDRSATT